MPAARDAKEQLRQKSTRRALVAVALAGLLGAATLAGAAGAQAAEVPGVTRDTVKLGFISSQTGVASPTFEDSHKSCQARVDAQNAAGGVHGRKIDLEIVDDQSGPNLTAAQDLVRSRNVFAVINNSGLAFLSWRFLKERPHARLARQDREAAWCHEVGVDRLQRLAVGDGVSACGPEIRGA
jgi:branched-chain amino acid transport system substrate-binding protein